uniref:Uncharacterized protein n=1 Tax=Arion vulgaris TaxID=1028688 RepID=A0A0B6ZI78_9EUPU
MIFSCCLSGVEGFNFESSSMASSMSIQSVIKEYNSEREELKIKSTPFDVHLNV